MPAIKCEKCSEKSVILLPFGPHYYCKTHFNEYFERKFKKTIRTNSLIKKNEKIGLAVSGGKDSITLLHLMHKFFGKIVDFHVIMIDEGIKNYRDKAIEKAVETCKKLKVPFTVIDLKKELGFTMTDIMKKIKELDNNETSCSYCGVFRRKLLNDYARKLGCDKLATGHNMDDETQSITMNFFNNELEKLSRLGAITDSKEIKNLIPRIKPLYDCLEFEIIAYSSLNNLIHFDGKCCPFSHKAKRNIFRSLLDETENKLPGTKHSIMKSFQNLKPLLIKKYSKKNSLGYCNKCGEVSSGKTCMACKKLEKLKKVE
ncbi:MAG: TIGR00269 family protein [archaeon]